MAESKTMEQEIYLSVEEAASLLNISRRTAQRKITGGKIGAIKINGERGGGRSGVKYMIPLSALGERCQIKYWKQKIGNQKMTPEKKPPKAFDLYGKRERQIIQHWSEVLKSWRAFRAEYQGDLQWADEQFIRLNQGKYPEINLSIDSLYKKWKAVREQDYDGLLDKRGKSCLGQSNIPELAWELFKYYYLDENQYSLKQCFDYTIWYCEKEMPEMLPDIPGYSTFCRAVESIPFAVRKFFREGDKAFEDKAAPYITRLYEDVEINEVWVADNHTLDVLTVEDGTEKLHRLYLTAFQDVCSRKVVGWYLTDHPNSDAVLYALRKAILKHGVPRCIYTDNGHEFLCFDVGGRGRRKTAKKDEHTPPPIFTRLGIEFWNAKVRNGRAKIVERTFKEFKDKFSRLLVGFTGGNTLEKPERLKYQVKSRKGMVVDSELRDMFDAYVEGMYNNMPQNGAGMHGRTPNEVYAQKLVTIRKASAEDLNLMLLRSTRMQTVTRKGVHLELYGEKLFYWDVDFLMKYQGRRVYLRYDPEDLREVRVYNEKDEFLSVVQIDNETILRYGASKKDIQKAAVKIKRFKSTVKEYKDNSGLEAYPKSEARDLMLWKAKHNLAAGGMSGAQKPKAKVVEIVRAKESVVAQEQEVVKEVEVNLERMIENSIKYKRCFR